jgi:hypothetical protein
MNLWQMLTIDWPCALHGWVWANLVVPLLASLERLTFKRLVYLAALTLAIIAMVQIVSIDIAFVWAGDITFYLEIASAVMFFTIRGHARQCFRLAIQKIRGAALHAFSVMRRYGVRQRRNANALWRKRSNPGGKHADEEGAVIGPGYYGFPLAVVSG